MKIFLSAIIFILSSINLFSETLILKDGSILKVKLKGQDSQNLVYTLKGKDTNISKTKIRKVIYARTPEVENKQIQDELNKLKQEKLSKQKFTPEEEAEAAKELEEEIAKAIAEQERQERLNLSFEERIQKLENEVGDLKSVSGLSDTGDRLAKLESELKELKSRTRRIEKFLDIDPDIEEYYSKPRSMWSVVWRSALLPGWGLSYARDSSGVYYSSLFVVSALGGIAYQESISSAERKLDKKIRDDFFVQPLLQGAFVTGLARTASSTTAGNDLLNTYTQFQTFNANSKLIRTLDSRNDLNREEDIANKMLQFAAGVYVVQLIHSAIVGYYWAKKVPKKFSDFETEKKSGWNLQLIPLPRINSTNLTQGMEMRLGYSFEF